MRKTFTYRLDPTSAQRRQASVQRDDQQTALRARTAEWPSLAGVPPQVLQHVAVRPDLAVRAFFRRLQAGGRAPGSPRFRSEGRDGRRSFPQVPMGCRLQAAAKRLRVPHVGQVKVVLHRPLKGTPKTATLHRSRTGTWSVYCSGDCDWSKPSPLLATGQQGGLDVGLTPCAVPTQGAPLATPRCLRRAECTLAGARRHLALAKQLLDLSRGIVTILPA